MIQYSSDSISLDSCFEWSIFSSTVKGTWAPQVPRSHPTCWSPENCEVSPVPNPWLSVYSCKLGFPYLRGYTIAGFSIRWVPEEYGEITGALLFMENPEFGHFWSTFLKPFCEGDPHWTITHQTSLKQVSLEIIPPKFSGDVQFRILTNDHLTKI